MFDGNRHSGGGLFLKVMDNMRTILRRFAMNIHSPFFYFAYLIIAVEKPICQFCDFTLVRVSHYASEP